MTNASGQCEKCKASNLYKDVACRTCGARLPWADAVQSQPKVPPSTVQPSKVASPVTASKSGQISGIAAVGIILMLLGGLDVAYFMFLYDTSVAVPVTEFMGTSFGGGRVNNIGLMAERQNGILLGFGLGIIGLVLYLTNRPRD